MSILEAIEETEIHLERVEKEKTKADAYENAWGSAGRQTVRQRGRQRTAAFREARGRGTSRRAACNSRLGDHPCNSHLGEQPCNSDLPDRRGLLSCVASNCNQLFSCFLSSRHVDNVALRPPRPHCCQLHCLALAAAKLTLTDTGGVGITPPSSLAEYPRLPSSKSSTRGQSSMLSDLRADIQPQSGASVARTGLSHSPVETEMIAMSFGTRM
jgi:hypothetical protein